MSHHQELQTMLDDLEDEADAIYDSIMEAFEDGSTLICMVEALAQVLVDVIVAHIQSDHDRAHLFEAVTASLRCGLVPGENLQ